MAVKPARQKERKYWSHLAVKIVSFLKLLRPLLGTKSLKKPIMSTKSRSTSVQVLTSPNKSPTDKKEYRVIQLANGLKALLVSDTSYDLSKLDEEEAAMSVMSEAVESDQGSDEESGEEDEDMEGTKCIMASSGLKNSAASLCIGVGSFSDLQELPGLAHFLEHMVFMGSEKYPDENDFDQFVQKHGGYDNAHTDCEMTTFYFEVQRRDFVTALDKFAQFFVSPLMKKQALQREREAVDSEFQMALPSDYHRKTQIIGSLAKENHPMAKFMWGNATSLKPTELSDDEVHAKLHTFKDRHYSAHSMTLAIQSQETLDTLQAMVTDSFAAIPNNGLDKETFSHMPDPFKTQRFCKLYKMVPMQDIYQLTMTWDLQPLMDKYRVKPLNYLSWIIGHEGKGSLIAYLRQKVWALSLTAGNDGDGFEMNSTYSAFSVTITLTKPGFDNVSQVIVAVFSYLKMLQHCGPNERIFREIQEIEELDFRFGDEPQPVDNVESLSESMQLYPPDLYITGDDLLFDYDPDIIDKCTRQLGQDNVNLFLLSRDYKDLHNRTELWFETKYNEEDIPEDWKLSWKTVPVFPELHLPDPNKYIAKDLELKPAVDGSSNPAFPVAVVQETSGELYYRKDETFKQPRAVVHGHVIVPAVLASVKHAVCLDLVVSCLGQLMIEDTYPADIAQLNYSVYCGERGILVKLNGLNEKLPLLLQTILEHFKSFSKDLDEDLFKAVREQVKKNYYNNFLKPDKLVREVRLAVLQDVFWTARQKHRIISDITVEDVVQFNELMYKEDLFVQVLVQGNVTEDEARDIYGEISGCFIKPGGQCDLKVPETRCNQVPEGEKVIRVEGFNKQDANTLVTNYYQMGPSSLRDHVYLEVGSMLMEEPVFDILRTKEQLGYSVFSMLRNTYGITGLSVTVNSQATKYTPDHVDQRIEAFLEWFLTEKLGQLTDEEFDTTIATLVKMKKTSDVTLNDETNRNWSEVHTREYLFDRRLKDVQLLEQCDKQEMVNFVTTVIDAKGDDNKRRKLSVQVVGYDTSNEDGEPVHLQDPDAKFDLKYRPGEPKEHFVTDCAQFKATLDTFPVHHIVR